VKDREFVDLVKRMRDAQRAYFRDRTIGQLREATKLEEQVDKALRRDRDGQGALSFGEADGTA
jgi:hypothetical protein